MQPENDAASALILTFAHDLRVPLRSIVMTTQRIQRRPEELSAEIKTKLEEILVAARKQEELIAAVVEYDQSLHPGLSGDTPLALRLAIQTACMKVDAYRQARGASVTFDSEALPRVMVPSGISRVVEKVLHNSLKFQLADTTPVVRVEASQDADGRITIRVHDNGIGIESAYRMSVFEPFKRLNSAVDYPGSGLGLSICRRLLESIRGTIRIEDSLGLVLAISFPKWESAA